MGGGFGLGMSQEIVRVLDHELSDVQFIIITGQNQQLRRELEHSSFKNLVHIHGYVENVNVFMTAADILVTKPGGITCAEAIACGLPLVLFSPIPGQESRNAAFLIDQLVAIKVQVAGMAHKIEELLRDELRLRCMSLMAHNVARPHAAVHTIDLLEKIVGERT
ncbi:MAG: glycosyltransferase, partial [bacterium]|nr:glycosyltransferase [bacterium]